MISKWFLFYFKILSVKYIIIKEVNQPIESSATLDMRTIGNINIIEKREGRRS